MNTTNVVNTITADTLAPTIGGLGSAIFRPLDGFNHDSVSVCHTIQALRKRGDKSRITKSLAIEVPEFTMADVTYAITHYPVLAQQFINVLYTQQREILFDLAGKGAKEVKYQDITLAKVAESAVPVITGNNRLSGEIIKGWLQTERIKESLYVALAAKLGIGELPTDADTDRLNTVTAAITEGLAKLAAPNPILDASTRKSLTWIINAVSDLSGDDDTGISARLLDKLTPKMVKVAKVSLESMLGLED